MNFYIKKYFFHIYRLPLYSSDLITQKKFLYCPKTSFIYVLSVKLAASFSQWWLRLFYGQRWKIVTDIGSNLSKTMQKQFRNGKNCDHRESYTLVFYPERTRTPWWKTFLDLLTFNIKMESFQNERHNFPYLGKAKRRASQKKKHFCIHASWYIFTCIILKRKEPRCQLQESTISQLLW